MLYRKANCFYLLSSLWTPWEEFLGSLQLQETLEVPGGQEDQEDQVGLAGEGQMYDCQASKFMWKPFYKFTWFKNYSICWVYQGSSAFSTLSREVFNRPLDEVHPWPQWIDSLTLRNLQRHTDKGGKDNYRNYCSMFHRKLAENEKWLNFFYLKKKISTTST